MTLLRDLIDIPNSVGDSDFVVRASEGADLKKYVVTDDLRRNFDDALGMVAHAVRSGKSQAKFLHGSFGSGKSHFMAVLREILRHNELAKDVRGLAEPIDKAEPFLKGRKFLTLSFHMLDARSVEQAVLEGYLRQIKQLHPDAPVPAVHRSDALLANAQRLRGQMGDDKFFEVLGGGGSSEGTSGSLSADMAREGDWSPETYAAAAAEPPGTPLRDTLVSALTSVYFAGAVQSAEYLDLDTGLAVITRHAKNLGYDAMVFFLDELILWLSTKIADHTFVQTEGAKLNKLVESADSSRPLPIVSFVARQRNLEDFLGPQVGGTERAALADVMRSVQGRLGQDIVLADTNLPEITEKRLLKPLTEDARKTIDNAFNTVKNRRDVWDTLLLGAQFGDAGIGSDASAFRRLYPFSPALVATLVALSQALQRERTALKVMTELLVDRRDTLQVNDLIGVAALFEPLVLRGELPDRPLLKQKFQNARESYRSRFRPFLLGLHNITEAEAANHADFQVDDKLIKTLILGYLVPEVPALHNLTAAKLHALNFGSIASPLPNYESQIVLDRLRRLNADVGDLYISDGPDPVIQVRIAAEDYDRLLDLVPANETATNQVQHLVRGMICDELGIESKSGGFGEFVYQREWRGRKHLINVRFGNVRDRDNMPDNALMADGDAWRVVIDYPFDAPGHLRNEDFARIETLPKGSSTVFWMPLFLSDESFGRVATLSKVNYLLEGPSGNRIDSIAADQSKAWREGAKAYFQQRQQQLRSALTGAFKQAYGAAAPDPGVVEPDTVGILYTLADGLRIGDPVGGILRDAFSNLTGQLLAWSYPGTPALPEDEKTPTKAELAKILRYAREAVADPTKGIAVDQADQKTIKRICNPLRLGALSEHRYVLTGSTCWWSGHLTQGAAREGYTDHFPVHVLRSQLDLDKPRGFDHDLQNLILAVFAEEQQLGWYQHGTPVQVTTLQTITDQLELRHIDLPAEEVWATASKRASGILGIVTPGWRAASTVTTLTQSIRAEAQRYKDEVIELARSLRARANTLQLDTAASDGRLFHAEQVGKLLTDIANERNDVVLLTLIAEAGINLDDVAIGRVLKSAGSLRRALDTTQWGLLEAVTERAQSSHEPTARQIVDSLGASARHDAHVSDLESALRVAVDDATRLLITPTGGGGTGGGSGGQTGGGTGDGGQTGGGSGTGPTDGGTVAPKSRTVCTTTELDEVIATIRADLAGGRSISISWEVQ
ncbi:phage resistance protein [Actinoplanes bogorensis]|uniref:Phage resistance protein n=1 Tax=Paractinoplanes bogorensis TaxID=1610840 RepID=A0ABS5YYA1_9ACTN|nr:phage resistance protein [Actinoplanes bogorensis]MBU2668296.1 phage resistance protein [Actinoplanes bogorensis]